MKEVKNRCLTCSVFFVLFFLFSLFFFQTIDYKSRLLLFFPRRFSNSTLCHGRLRQLKIYMYDLPRQFNVGMLDPKLPVTAESNLAWMGSGGLRRQHSVEYWMMASLLYEGNGENGSTREAVRVMDPDDADLFFVPFFSSLSFNIHGLNMSDPNTVDQKLQRDMVKILRSSNQWIKSGGRDHIIPLHHPNAFRHYRDKVNSSIFIIADFGRTMNIAKLAKDVVAPYAHMVESYFNDDEEDPYDTRKTLLFFRGRTKRKEEGKVRMKLHKMLVGTPDVIYEEGDASEEGFKTSTEGMRSSKFCLHPAGDTPSSCRLFDAIVSHCIPVIVSDRIELPFENELDYKEFSIFFSVNEALTPSYMLTRLRGITEHEWMKMWRQLKSISHHFEFQYPPKKDDAVNMIWRQLRHKLPAIKLSVHRNRRLKIPDWW
ncbi:probable arabinosyltransferase ARAD1 isoform X2 [Olea europaea var. sylvestris]|uniref:probable arabinosyltransferase ARAD1 isoform X2 n=1 Tax=Olea europaea var. sylvestris TaxID=158386 RepID=UPI000C1D8BAA|nr:probable arabinosyltransferase ARAD1 isoform X2 [Olea europaea var. sylvestris]